MKEQETKEKDSVKLEEFRNAMSNFWEKSKLDDEDLMLFFKVLDAAFQLTEKDKERHLMNGLRIIDTILEEEGDKK